MIIVQECIKKLHVYMDRGVAYQAALALLEWDQETFAPAKADTFTSKVIGEISEAYKQVLVNDEVRQLLDQASQEQVWEHLTFEEQALVKQWKKMFVQLDCIPDQEYKAYSNLVSRATNVWVKAKKEKDFQIFAPTLTEIVNYKRKFAQYQDQKSKEKKSCLYDYLLEEFEPGFTVEILDTFFENLKKVLLPMLPKVWKASAEIPGAFSKEHYPKEEQMAVCKYLSKYLGFDFERGVMAESAHPFTTNLHKNDVRITNHFYEDNPESAIFSAIHETGHGLYELGIADSIALSIVGTGTSMGMHEGQSRFWENVIGRRESFWKGCFDILQQHFPKQMENVELKTFVAGINKSTPGMIRTEADELSYSLHIIIRYEVEKQLINGTLEVDQLEDAWNRLYEEYFGIVPRDAAEGVLQDVHWSCGDFGYFPSYAIGTAISAQMYAHLKKQMPIEQYLEEGNIRPIREYLKEHIYQYGMCKDTDTLLRDMTGEGFAPQYYLKYLEEKANRILNYKK